jgi:hypothetical protein
MTAETRVPERASRSQCTEKDESPVIQGSTSTTTTAEAAIEESASPSVPSRVTTVRQKGSPLLGGLGVTVGVLTQSFHAVPCARQQHQRQSALLRRRLATGRGLRVARPEAGLHRGGVLLGHGGQRVACGACQTLGDPAYQRAIALPGAGILLQPGHARPLIAVVDVLQQLAGVGDRPGQNQRVGSPQHPDQRVRVPSGEPLPSFHAFTEDGPLQGAAPVGQIVGGVQHQQRAAGEDGTVGPVGGDGALETALVAGEMSEQGVNLALDIEVEPLDRPSVAGRTGIARVEQRPHSNPPRDQPPAG